MASRVPVLVIHQRSVVAVVDQSGYFLSERMAQSYGSTTAALGLKCPGYGHLSPIVEGAFAGIDKLY